MKVKQPVIGGICRSTQGRDKNVKHVRLLPDKAETILAKFADGRQVFDSEIYSALKIYNNPPQGPQES